MRSFFLSPYLFIVKVVRVTFLSPYPMCLRVIVTHGSDTWGKDWKK